MKKALLVFLYLLLSLLLPACGPMVTYESLIEEAKLTGDDSKVEKFEKKAHKAEAFFENKRACLASHNHGWFCHYRGARRTRARDLTDIDELVKAYRDERHTCGCITREALRDMLRGRRF